MFAIKLFGTKHEIYRNKNERPSNVRNRDKTGRVHVSRRNNQLKA